MAFGFVGDESRSQHPLRLDDPDAAPELARARRSVTAVAGAVVRPDLLDRALRIGRNPDLALARNDSHRFFAALGDQVVTGPTLTNVNDFRALLIHPA